MSLAGCHFPTPQTYRSTPGKTKPPGFPRSSARWRKAGVPALPGKVFCPKMRLAYSFEAFGSTSGGS